MKINRVWEFAR